MQETDNGNDETIVYRPIGRIRSPHEDLAAIPIQPRYAKDCDGCIEIDPDYADGLKDLGGFSHIFVLCHLHKAGPYRLAVKPYLQDVERGVFATRAPCRPNPIGLSIVRLKRIEGCLLHIEGVDMLNGTPVLDIKPYAGRFDRPEDVRCGWLDTVAEEEASVRGRRGMKSGDSR